MNPAQLLVELNNFGYGLIEKDLAIDVNPHILSQHGNLTELSWARRNNLFSPWLSDTLISYISTIQAGSFSYLLSDGGLIQIGYLFDRENRLKKHRLAFIPCPIKLDVDISEQPLLDQVYEKMAQVTNETLLTNSEGESFWGQIKLRSNIRFDYSIDDAAPDHPASHLTLISNDCRIPAKSPLTAKGFIRIIFENFYKDVWKSSPSFTSLYEAFPMHRYDSCLQEDDQQKAHINWP